MSFDAPTRLWKIEIHEPGSTLPFDCTLWIIAPDLPAAYAVARTWMDDTGFTGDSPTATVVAAELISNFVLASAGVVLDNKYLEWKGDE
jgi:hypothetical protein